MKSGWVNFFIKIAKKNSVSILLVFLMVVISTCIMIFKECPSELEKCVFGGIISGLSFYLIIDLIPSVSKKIQNFFLLREEIEGCIEYARSIYQKLKEEWPDLNIKINAHQRFFLMLEKQTINYYPKSQHMKRKTILNNQFIDLNLGQILDSECERLKEKISRLVELISITQMVDFVGYKNYEKFDNLAKSRLYHQQNKALLENIVNSASLIGSSIDGLFDSLIEIQKIFK